MTTLDVAIVGAGPAGLAAASLCAEHSLKVAVYDEQRAPGGQIYRAVTTSRLPRLDILGDEYSAGAALVRAFERSGAAYVPRATVWSVAARADGAHVLGVVVDAASAGGTGARAAAPLRSSHAVEARAIILATGAHERPFPVPGWTLPGVHTAGAAQILLKTAGLVPQGRTVLAGCGPLLWLVAAQLLRAGASVDAILDTTPPGRLLSALRQAPEFLWSAYFAKGRALVREVRRRTRVVEHVTDLRIDGDTQAREVRYTAGGVTQVLPVDQVLLHQGVVPDVNVASAAGCALRWNEPQACFEPVVDAWGGSSAEGVFVAGDGGGIAGARAAEARGRLTALAVANALGRIDGARRDRAAVPHRRALATAQRGRRFLDLLFRPPDPMRIPDGDTLACRCEEVTAEAIAAQARAGCPGPNQVKAFLRCGMGPCQGRSCGLTVTELIAREQRRAPADVGYFRLRAPVKPIALEELAAYPSTPDAQAAVVRDGAAAAQRAPVSPRASPPA